MGKLFSIVLILLGILAARETIEAKMPKTKRFLDQLRAYSDYFGVAALILGTLWFLGALSMLFRYLTVKPLAVLEIWVAVALMFANGFIFGWIAILKVLGEPIPEFLVRLGQKRDRLLPYQQQIGIASIVMGCLYLL